MKKTTFKRNKLGFTLAELLLVITIVAILVGLGVTGFVALRRNIVIAKYDDLAREIYVAAQNQLTRLEANGMDELTVNALNAGTALSSKPSDYAADDWDQVKSFYHCAAGSDAQIMAVLLPLGTVADDVRSNGFYVIEYNMQTRTVYGVFYSAESFAYAEVSEMENFRTSRSVRKGPMVGYYGGSAVVRDPQTHCPTPKLEIINNNELKLNILNAAGVTVLVKISDGNNTVDASSMVKENSILLDSMLEGKHFHELFSTLTPGKDLTITVTYSKENAISSSASISANSLFATREEGEDGDTVTLAWARHLQNLETTVSGLVDSEIGIARQTEHIQWNEDFGNFVSISNDGANDKLLRFEGSNLEIRDLIGINGLFAKTKEGMQLSGIRIVNPVIMATGTDPVGALVGTTAKNTQITMCGVYCNKITGGKVDYAAYQNCTVNGGTAITGGLVGKADQTTVKSSFAALPSLSGQSGASLIGSAMNCEITNSYANCDDLKSGFHYFLNGSDNTITRCYAVGNVADAKKSDFCAAANNTVTDCYYAVSHRQFADNKDLAATQFCYKGNGGNWITINQEQMQNATQPGGWAADWAKMIAPLSHPYRMYLDGRAFPYPAIAELDHYGSWPDGGGMVNLKILMSLLNNETAGYASFAGRVVVKNADGTTIFDSDEPAFDGQDTIQVAPGTTVTIVITEKEGYKYLYTNIDGTQEKIKSITYTVNKDTEAKIIFRQTEFELTGIPAVGNTNNTHIGNSKYYIDLTSPSTTLEIADANQSENVETGSKVTVRPIIPDGYIASVAWYTPAGGNSKTYLTKDGDGNYTFTMPAEAIDVHVMYTTDVAEFKIQYYIMDKYGQYPSEPSRTDDYQCGLGSQINKDVINTMAESSGVLVTIGGERVLYLDHATVTAKTNRTVFSCELDESGVLTDTLPPHITANGESPYTVKIYIARKQYSVTLTADTHISGVRFGEDGTFVSTVTKHFYYGAAVTAEAQAEPGYRFTYWDPQDTRFMMSGDEKYTFEMPSFDLNLKASAAMDHFLVTINLLENDESWLFSSPSRQADPIQLILVNSKDGTQYPMQVLTEDSISYAMQAVVPVVSDYGRGYYVKVKYESGMEAWLYTADPGEGNPGNNRLLLNVRDRSVVADARFYSVTYHPNRENYIGSAPKGGAYPMYYHLKVAGNTGLLRDANGKEFFNGWKDYHAEGTGNFDGGDVITITRRTDMFAKWEKYENLHVVYHPGKADGGELPVDNKQYAPHEKATIKGGSLTRKGYQFIGWSRNQNGTGYLYVENEQVQMNGKLELYPVWKPEDYTVKFYDSTGKLLTGTEFELGVKHYGDRITVQETVGGQKLAGWALTKGGAVVCLPGKEYTVTGNTELYACAAADYVIVTYMDRTGKTTYKIDSFGSGVSVYLSFVPDTGAVTAWSTKPYGKGDLYICDESGRSEKTVAFTENTTLYAVTGKVYNYNKQLWFDTLCEAVREGKTVSGDTLIVYRDTVEPVRIEINKSIYVIAHGNRTVKWKDGATNGYGERLLDEVPNVYGETSKDNQGNTVTSYKQYGEVTKEFVGCMYVFDDGNAVTVEFGSSDITNLSMEGSSLTFDANRQSRVIALGNQASFHMYDGITLTNGKRDGTVHVVRFNNRPANHRVEVKGGNGYEISHRSSYGGGVYAGAGSVFYMHGGTVSFCEAVSGGGVYLLGTIKEQVGSRMYMGDMVKPEVFSATAIYYTEAHDDKLNEDIFINASGVNNENYKNYYVTVGEPKICYNTSTQSAYGDGGGGLLMFDLKNGDLILYRGSITNNTTSGNGGGIVTDAGPQSSQKDANSAKLRIYEVDISHNTSNCRGGGIFQWQGTVYIYNSTIRQNRAQYGGGAFLMANGSVSNIEFYFGDISDNEATADGGGVFAYYGADFIMKGGNLCRNKAKNGGGAYMQASSPILTVDPPKYNHPSTLDLEAGLISGNIATENGGAVYSSGLINMTGGTVCNNSARYLGGGIMVGGQFNLSGGSLYGNTDTDYQAKWDDEDNVNPGPNDIYLVGDHKITIPDGGIALSGEKRVYVDCERDGSLRFSNTTPPYRFAVYQNLLEYDANDALYFAYHGTRSSALSKQKDLTVEARNNDGLYFVEVSSTTTSKSNVTLNPNYTGGTVTTLTNQTVGSTINLNIPARPGYYLAGWAKTPYAIEEDYVLFYDVVDDAWKTGYANGVWQSTNAAPIYTVEDLASQTLYAQWRPYVVVYDVGDAKDSNVQVPSVSVGPHITVRNPYPMEFTKNSRTYHFVGWKIKGSTDGKLYKPMEQLELTDGNLRLEAVWKVKGNNTYVITFYFNDGTSDVTGELRRDVVVSENANHTIDINIYRANKILVGWSTNQDGTGTVYPTGGVIENIHDNMSLYAVWADAVTLTYDVNGGEESNTVTSVQKGSPVTIGEVKPTRDGYTFLGWAESKDAAEVKYRTGDTIERLEENTTLYAVWREETP